jgi:hypothetical protein
MQNADQDKHVESEIKDILRPQQHLADLKIRKQKIENILPKLEEQINDLNQESDPEIIKQIEQEIKSLNQELGIFEETKQVPLTDGSQQEAPVDGSVSKKSSVSDNSSPSSNNLNLAKSTLQDLLTDLKIVEDYLINVNKINEANKENLTKTADGKNKYETDQIKYQESLEEIKQIRDKFTDSSDQSEIIKTRAEFRQK